MSKGAHWDQRYLAMARFVASWSRDPSTQAGAVIVTPRGGISVGFNGFPRAMPDRSEWYSDRTEKYSRIIHAEKNALLFAGGLLPEGCTLYTWPLPPCDRCCVEMLQAGIMRYVAPDPSPELRSRWNWDKTKQYLDECGATYALLALADPV